MGRVWGKGVASAVMAQGDVIVRQSPGTTTYHFGRQAAICGEVVESEAIALSLN